MVNSNSIHLKTIILQAILSFKLVVEDLRLQISNTLRNHHRHSIKLSIQVSSEQINLNLQNSKNNQEGKDNIEEELISLLTIEVNIVSHSSRDMSGREHP
jgi:hypothetical protein